MRTVKSRPSVIKQSAAVSAGALLLPRITKLEQDALDQILLAGLPEGIAQYRFCKRLWKFDRAWPGMGGMGRYPTGTALELEGGIYQRGGGWHQSIQRYTSDCEKYSEAACLGWVVIRCTAEQVRSGQMLDWLSRALRVEGL